MDSPGKSSFLTGVGKLLAEGPFELLTHIQLFLDPVDISSTCLAVRECFMINSFRAKACSKCCFFRHANIFLELLSRGLCA